MNSQKIMALIRELNTLLKQPVLDAYLGLYKVRQLDNQDPEGCSYIQLAQRKFFEDGEFEKLNTVIKNLTEVIDE